MGIILAEVAGRFRFQTDPTGGPWVRQLLNLDKPTRLSKPALETLAIIAYRQPITRAEIEAVRGVNIDSMMRNLLDLQLIRVLGRSELPGHPALYGTTNLFLEHFGLSSVKNLPGIEQLARREAERVERETDDRRQRTDAGPEKAEDGQQPDQQSPKVEAETTNNGQPKTEEEEEEEEKEEKEEEAAADENEYDEDEDDEHDEDDEDEDDEGKEE